MLGRSVMTRRRGALLEVGAEWFIRATGLLTVLLLVSILVLLARQGVRLFLDLDYPIALTAATLGNTLVWHATPTRNARQSLSVRMRFRDGRTRVVVEERLVGQAVGLFVGLGVGGGIGPMGAYIALIAKLGVIGLVAPLVWIPMMLLLARTIFSALSRRRARTMNEVMRRIESNIHRNNLRSQNKRCAREFGQHAIPILLLKHRVRFGTVDRRLSNRP